jgi:hypothetical protein
MAFGVGGGYQGFLFELEGDAGFSDGLFGDGVDDLTFESGERAGLAAARRARYKRAAVILGC